MTGGQGPLLLAAAALGGVATLAAVILLLGGDPRRHLRARARKMADGGGAREQAVARLRADHLARRPSRLRTLDGLLARAGMAESAHRYGLRTLAFAALAFGALVLLTPVPAYLAFVLALAVAVIGAFALLKLRIARRRAAFLDKFPDGIGLMVRGLRAGLPLSQCLKSAAAENDGVAGEAFAVIVDQMQLGRSLEQALMRADARVGIQEFSFFVMSLTIQARTGGNLADTLEGLSETLRKRRQLKLKIKAMSGEARASALIIGGLPFAVGGTLMAVSPGYVDALFADPRGQKLVTLAIISMLFGFVVMARMIRFRT